MPPVPAVLASDAELATVYQWLGGVDAVKIPAPIAVGLKASPRIAAGGQTLVEAEVTIATATLRTKVDPDSPGATLPTYRVTLLTQANAPAADQAVEYQLGGRGGWSKVTLDQQGEAVLGPDGGLVGPAARATGKKSTMLFRMALAAGKYALVIEVVDRTEAANPLVVGIGTAILKVE